MSAQDNGGPAFPCVHDIPPAAGVERAIKVEYGMALRDYFAAKAMEAILPAAIAGMGADKSSATQETLDAIFASAYEFADAMLRARSA